MFQRRGAEGDYGIGREKEQAADTGRGVGRTASCKASEDILRIWEFFLKVTYPWRVLKQRVTFLKDLLATVDGLP